MFNRKKLISALGEMSRGMMFSQGYIKVDVTPPQPMIKPHGYDDAMCRVKQNKCADCC
tara:strand:- start:177 stop:350 length:174 start_codon:yes stop_codon:yes gene_type:complete